MSQGSSVTFDGMTVESNHATEEQVRESIGAPPKENNGETDRLESGTGSARPNATGTKSPAAGTSDADAGNVGSVSGDDSESDDDIAVDPASEAGKTLAKRKRHYGERIGELTGKWRTTERERDAAKAETARLKAELEAFKTGKSTVDAPSPIAAPSKEAAREYDGTDPNDPMPTIEQFAEHEDPYRALVKAEIKWDARRDARIAKQQESTTTAQREFETRARSWADRRDAYVASEPTFKEKAGAFLDSLFAGTPIGDTVMDSAVGPQLALHLATHPQELERISGLHWRDQLRALGKLEDKLETAHPAAAERGTAVDVPTGTRAKPIPKPLGGSPVASDESEASDDLSVDDFIRKENIKEAKARRR